MSHSSKWTFKDKGFLFGKLQLTAFNSQHCLGFRSSWNDSDFFFFLLVMQLNKFRKWRHLWQMERWVVKSPDHTKLSRNLELHCNLIWILLKGDVSNVSNNSTLLGILCDTAWMLSTLHRCKTYPGSQTVAHALSISTLFKYKNSMYSCTPKGETLKKSSSPTILLHSNTSFQF